MANVARDFVEASPRASKAPATIDLTTGQPAATYDPATMPPERRERVAEMLAFTARDSRDRAKRARRAGDRATARMWTDAALHARRASQHFVARLRVKSPQTGSSRAPRRARAARPRPTTCGDADDGPPPRPGPSPVTITDQTCAAATGLEPRTWKRRLVDWGVPHGRVGRRTLCLASDWASAVARVIGRKTPVEGAAPEPHWYERASAALRAGGRR